MSSFTSGRLDTGVSLAPSGYSKECFNSIGRLIRQELVECGVVELSLIGRLDTRSDSEWQQRSSGCFILIGRLDTEQERSTEGFQPEVSILIGRLDTISLVAKEHVYVLFHL